MRNYWQPKAAMLSYGDANRQKIPHDPSGLRQELRELSSQDGLPRIIIFRCFGAWRARSVVRFPASGSRVRGNPGLASTRAASVSVCLCRARIIPIGVAAMTRDMVPANSSVCLGRSRSGSGITNSIGQIPLALMTRAEVVVRHKIGLKRSAGCQRRGCGPAIVGHA